MTTDSSSPPSIFQRIGGRDVVHGIVEDFYARIEADDRLRPLFPAEMAPGRERQKLFMEQWLGGEAVYSERYGHPRLRRQHAPFAITEEIAARWVQHLTAAMQAAGVSDEDVNEIIAAIRPVAEQMVNSAE